jgi:hypothetical protein
MPVTSAAFLEFTEHWRIRRNNVGKPGDQRDVAANSGARWP